MAADSYTDRPTPEQLYNRAQQDAWRRGQMTGHHCEPYQGFAEILEDLQRGRLRTAAERVEEYLVTGLGYPQYRGYLTEHDLHLAVMGHDVSTKGGVQFRAGDRALYFQQPSALWGSRRESVAFSPRTGGFVVLEDDPGATVARQSRRR